MTSPATITPIRATNTTTAPPAVLPGTYKPGSKPPSSIAVCIYGKGGVGKTTLLGTMPGKGLVLDIPQMEGGTVVLSDKANIDVKEVTSWNDVDAIYWFLAKENHDYRWVGIDSITAMAELARRKTIKERTLADDAHTVSLQEWGKVGSLVAELIYKFRTLPIATIWIAQERRHGGEMAQEAFIGPDVSPRALAALQPSMFLLGRLSVEQGLDGTYQRQLRVGPHPFYLSKMRASPGADVPPLIANPNLGKLLRYALGVPGAERPEAVSEGLSLVLGGE